MACIRGCAANSQAQGICARVQEHEPQLAGEPPGGVRSRENELMAGAVAGYGRRVGIYTMMVRRARLPAVAPGMGLAPAR
jgi:hypothetical protein